MWWNLNKFSLNSQHYYFEPEFRRHELGSKKHEVTFKKMVMLLDSLHFFDRFWVNRAGVCLFNIFSAISHKG